MQIICIVKETLFEPRIDKENLRHVIRGEDLRVNCSVQLDRSMLYALNWTTPQVNKLS